MKRTSFCFNYTLFICIVILSVCTTLHAQNEQKDRGFIVKVGEMAPNIQLSLLSGDTLSLVDLKGKVVVLQFTASWCSVCRKEMPHLEQEVWLTNKNDDFILIGVDIDEDPNKIAPFIEQMQVTYPVALDTDKDLFYQFAGPKAGVTRNIVIDKEGEIAFLTRLFDPVEFDAMKSKITALLN
jgi:peroxiredoxin